MSNVAQVETNVNETVGLPFKESMTDKWRYDRSLEQDLLAEQIKGVVANALGVIAQSGSTISCETTLTKPSAKPIEYRPCRRFASASPAGIAQKAVGQAQRYIGEAEGGYRGGGYG